MSKTKLFLCLACCALLLFSAQADTTLISQEDIEQDSANYNTATAEYGVFSKRATTSAMVYYPHVTNIKYEGQTAEFVEMLVKRKQEVKEGDPLVRVKIAYDLTVIEEKELSLQRAREAFEREKQDRLDTIAETEEELEEMRATYQRRFTELELQKMRVQYDQYVMRQERAIARQQKALDELKESVMVDTVYAPYDGIVTDVQYFSAGDSIGNGTVLCELSNQDVVLLGVNNENFRYGMPVTIECGPPKSRESYTGRVIAAADSFRNVSTGMAIVAFDSEEDAQNANLKNPKVYTDAIYLEDVLLIPARCAEQYSGKYYVQKLGADGQVSKRVVIPGLRNTEFIWALQGVEEGETLILP